MLLSGVAPAAVGPTGSNLHEQQLTEAVQEHLRLDYEHGEEGYVPSLLVASIAGTAC